MSQPEPPSLSQSLLARLVTALDAGTYRDANGNALKTLKALCEAREYLEQRGIGQPRARLEW